MNIYVDIETIPAQNPAFLAAVRAEVMAAADAEIAALKPPGNIKDPAKIEAWHQVDRPAKEAAIRAEANTRAEEQYRATSLDGAYGHIAVIGYAIDDGEPVTLYAKPDDPLGERELISQFFEAMQVVDQGLRQPTFIGHNLVGFDLRFLFQRAVVLGIRPPTCIPFHAKPWDERVFDTMTRWAGDRNRVSLAKLCDALGLPPKGAEIGDEIDGSMVWDYIQQGRIADVAAYCAGDIRRTRDAHRRLTFAFDYPEAKERVLIGEFAEA